MWVAVTVDALMTKSSERPTLNVTCVAGDAVMFSRKTVRAKEVRLGCVCVPPGLCVAVAASSAFISTVVVCVAAVAVFLEPTVIILRMALLTIQCDVLPQQLEAGVTVMDEVGFLPPQRGVTLLADLVFHLPLMEVVVAR
mgnify:CR=1 FL=1